MKIESNLHLLAFIEFLGGPVPPLYTGFPGVRANVRTCLRVCLRVRKPGEAEMTMTEKMKIVSLDEKTLKRYLSCVWDSSRT